MKIKLWKDGYVKTIEDKLGCKYNEINTSKDNRIKSVTSIAAISRGKDKSNNPEKRYEHLLKEAAPNVDFYKLMELEENNEKLEKVAGRPLEFCPVVLTCYNIISEVEYAITYGELRIKLKDEILHMNHKDFSNGIGKFSYVEEITYDIWEVYTNARALINAGIDESKIPFNRPVELIDYFIIELKVPYFVFAQMRTHGLLSQVAVSERVTEEEDYWLPDDILERVSKSNNPIKGVLQGAKNKEEAEARLYNVFFNGLTIKSGKEILKSLGYKKEIYNRYPSFLKYKTFIIGGWLNNPYQWGHFLLEREAFDKVLSSWTQEQTKETAKAIRNVIEKYLSNLNCEIKNNIEKNVKEIIGRRQ